MGAKLAPAFILLCKSLTLKKNSNFYSKKNISIKQKLLEMKQELLRSQKRQVCMFLEHLKINTIV